MIGLEQFLIQLHEEIDIRGFSIPAFAKMLNRRYPNHNIDVDTMYRIFNRRNKKPNRRHLWMLCDWLHSLDVVVPVVREFADNYLQELLKHERSKNNPV